MRKKRSTATKLVLRLYVAGEAPNSTRAVANLRALCAAHFDSCHAIEIVDMLQHPLRALADGIIVTPTLLRLTPLPVQRIIGDLGDSGELLSTLGRR